MGENNVRSAPAGPVPDITVNDYHLGEILSELNCWCEKWKGNINAVYNNALSMADQIAQLFQVVYTTVEAQEDVTGAFKQLYDFVNDYFTNLDLQDEVNNKINGMVADGTFVNLLLPYIQNGGVPVFVTSTSQMTDSKRIYVLMPNGHIYYWNGNAFTDSNIVYGNTQYPVNSVSSQNLGNIPAFAYVGFPMNNVGVFLTSNGSLQANANYEISPYYPVNPNTDYLCSGTGGGYLCYYTKDFVFISSLVMSSATSFTTPEDCYYIRVSLSKQNSTKVYGPNNDNWLSGMKLDDIIKILHENSIPCNTYLGDDISMVDYNNPKCIKNAYLNASGVVTSTTTSPYKIHPLIAVEPSTVYHTNINGGGYICFYDENFDFISSLSENTGVTITLTTPENCKYAWISIRPNTWFTKNTTYSNSLLQEVIKSIAKENDTTMLNMRQTYGYNGDLTIKYVSEDGNISTSYGGYPNEKITVTRTSIQATITGSTKVNETFASLLTDRPLIFVHQFDKPNNSETYLVTDGVTVHKYTSTFSASGRITSTNTFNLSSAKMVNPSVWMFGDSYLGMSNDRIGGALKTLGWKVENLFGWPGATSDDSISNLTNMLTYGQPDVLVWMLGMNGSEQSSINALTTAKELCSKYNVLLIPTTIPNVPDKPHNTYNAFIKENFAVFIDWNKAVNTTETGDAWYDGMLSSDNVHPTTLGAQCLAIQTLGIAPLNKIQ